MMMRALGRTATRSSRLTSAPSRMNSVPKMRCPTSSLKAVSSLLGTSFWLARTRPSIVVAISPASGAMTLAAANEMMAAEIMAGLSRWSGIQCLYNAIIASAATIAPAIAPAPRVMPICNAAAPGLESCKVASRTTIASVAPTGSITMPSQRKIAPVGSRGRAKWSSGITTVGPDTTRIAPMSAALDVDTLSKRRAVAPQPISQVTNAPTVTSRRTTDRPAVRRSIFRPSPPS